MTSGKQFYTLIVYFHYFTDYFSLSASFMTLDYQFYNNEASVMGILCSSFFSTKRTKHGWILWWPLLSTFLMLQIF